MKPRSPFTRAGDPALLDLLYTEEDALPPQAVEEILRRGATLAEPLARILEDEALWKDEGPRGWAVLHASLLLASLKPPAAFHRLLAALDRADLHGVDYLLEEMPAVLASFGPGAAPELAQRAETAEIGIHAVLVLIDALCLIGRRHAEARALIAGCLRRLIAETEGDEEIRVAAATRLLHFASAEDRPRLQEFAGTAFPSAELDAALRGEDLGDPVPAGDWLDFYLPEEVEARHQEWENAEAEGEEEGDDDDEDDESVLTEADRIAPPPLARKPGPARNDPCPCGSGRKYKKCCGR